MGFQVFESDYMYLEQKEWTQKKENPEKLKVNIYK